MSNGTASHVQEELFPGEKLCECGCGAPTPLGKWTDRRTGIVKGQPVRYLPGHGKRGKVVSAETREKLRASHLGPLASNWRGADASYRALHGYLCKHNPKTGICEECGKRSARTQYALIHGRQYTRNREDYREMCPRCHMRYDLGGRKVSAETSAKLSAARRAWWERRREAGLARRPEAPECSEGHPFTEASTYRDPHGRRWCRICKRARARAAALPLKGHAVGERAGAAKLTEASVTQIRAKHAQGQQFSALAREYNVSRGAVANLVKRKTWKHVA